MSAKNKRRKDPFKRKTNVRSYRPVYWVSTEGETEQDYFSMSAFRDSEISLKFVPNIHPCRRHPQAVLKRLKKGIAAGTLKKNDHAWLVIDRDDWGEHEFQELLSWQSKNPLQHHLLVSNPKFELFLLMHYESAKGSTTTQGLDRALKQHLPHYDKRIKSSTFSRKDIQEAIRRAKAKRQTCEKELSVPGVTDAHLLAEALLAHQPDHTQL